MGTILEVTIVAADEADARRLAERADRRGAALGRHPHHLAPARASWRA